MPTLIMLLFMAYAQDKSNKPAYVWAGVFALLNLVLTLISGGGFLGGIIGAVILGLYAWGYFAILRRFSDHVVLWLMLCVGGLVLPIILTFTLA